MKKLFAITLILSSTCAMAMDDEENNSDSKYTLKTYVYAPNKGAPEERAPRPGEPAYYQSHWNKTPDPYVRHQPPMRRMWGLSPDAFAKAVEYDQQGTSGVIVGGLRILDISSNNQNADDQNQSDSE